MVSGRPVLTHADGKFWLVYTDVKRFDGNFKDTHNYLTTCDTIDGEWSDPIYLNSSGFDPSLFHDDDGRKWFLNMVWDHRPDRTFFGGIYLQEYCIETQGLVGEIKNIFPGSELGLTEGPHLYKKDGFYYLLTAEGGTGYDHAMTMARSRSLQGPYEVDPIGHFVTAKDSPSSRLQRCGHGDLVETQTGEWYAVHLCSRPLDLYKAYDAPLKLSPMGRESAIEKVYWDEEGWLRLETGGSKPQDQPIAPDLEPHPWPVESTRYEFNASGLPADFQWLRTPYPDDIFSLTERPGYLRLIGRESIGSLYHSSLVARRQQSFCFSASTKMEFLPKNFQQMAGLINYYNGHKFHYLYISSDSEIGRHLGIMSCEGDLSLTTVYPLQNQLISLPEDGPIYLRAEVDYERLLYSWSLDGEGWNEVPVVLDQGLLSDEVGKGDGANFTGTFVGVCCQDVSGIRQPADVEWFDYRETADD